MQRLSQYDNRWKNNKFGTLNSPLTIGGWGCAVTSLANHSDNFTPVDIANFCDFVPEANLIWASISKIPGFSFNLADRIWSGDINAIRQRIKNGMKGIIEIAQGANRPMHWLAVVSYSEGGFVCIDPLNPSTDTIVPNNRVTGGCFFTINNNSNDNMSSITFENEQKFNEWVLEHGVARIQELTGLKKEGFGYNLPELYMNIEGLRKEKNALEEKLSQIDEIYKKTIQGMQTIIDSGNTITAQYAQTIKDLNVEIEKLKKGSSVIPTSHNPSSTKSPLQSKKFWVAVAGMAGYVATRYFAVDSQTVTDLTTQILQFATELGIFGGVTATYLNVQGAIDANQK